MRLMMKNRTSATLYSAEVEQFLMREKRNAHIRPRVRYAERTFEISQRPAGVINPNQPAFQLRYSKALIKITAENESTVMVFLISIETMHPSSGPGKRRKNHNPVQK